MENAVHAMNTYVAIEDPNSPNTFIDVSEKAHNARMPFSRQDVDSSTFGQGDMTSKSGMRDSSFNLDAYNDADLNELLYNIYMSESPVRVRYGPEGNAAGKERYTAYFNMTGWEPGGSVQGLNASSITFHRTGATTRDTF
jgi:hypothetical protein